MLAEPQKRAYREGYYSRCRFEGDIMGFVESIPDVPNAGEVDTKRKEIEASGDN
jgi:hypothetical protein